MFMILYPLIVRHSVLNDPNPIPGLTNHFTLDGLERARKGKRIATLKAFPTEAYLATSLV
jgi:hypothetical protein